MNKIPPAGASIAAICASLVLVWALTGCKFFGADPAPPSRTESYLFDVITNLVPKQVWKTNFVDVPVPVDVLKTNELNEVNQVTNTIIIKQVELVTATNWVEAYTWTPKTNVVQYTQTAGTVANMVMPGSGGLVVGLLTAGLAAWARLRSHKKTEGTLVQNIESVLEFVEAVPNGSQYTSAIKGILKQDQEGEGQREKIKAVMRENVDASDAKSSASKMQKTLTTATAAGVNPIL